MAYCAYCGKEIPEGTACDCPDAQTIMLAVQQAMNAQRAAAPTPAPAPAKSKKSLLWLAILLTAVLMAAASGVAGYFIYPLVNGTPEKSSGGSSKNKAYYSSDRTEDDDDDTDTDDPSPQRSAAADTEDTAQTAAAPVYTQPHDEVVPSDDYEEKFLDYYAASYSADGAETFYSYIYPEVLSDALRSDGRLSQLISERNESISGLLSSGASAEVWQITDEKKLTDDQLDAVEDYFGDVCGNYGVGGGKIKVTDGVEINADYIYTYGNGSVTTRSAAICVVYIEDDGWKVVLSPADSL